MDAALTALAAPFRLLGRALAMLWGFYSLAAEAPGQPWTGMIHSTVFGTLGTAIAAWILR